MIIKDDLKYLIFSEIYFKIDEPRAKRKALLIVEAALRCIARKGFDDVTFEMIARDAAVSRPLIRHYFDDLDDVRETAVKYVRLLFQKLAVDFMAKEVHEDQMLRRYVESCFHWITHHKMHALVWLSFLHRCARQKNSRALNTAAVQTGEQRITALLVQGKSKGIFQFEASAATAKCIQSLITGALVTSVSENLSDYKIYSKTIERECLKIAGAKLPA